MSDAGEPWMYVRMGTFTITSARPVRLLTLLGLVTTAGIGGWVHWLMTQLQQ